MKNILLVLILSLSFLGCSAKTPEDSNVQAKLVVGKDLGTLTLNDQFGKAHTVGADTTKLIFAFAKDTAHICNDFFKTQKDDYLTSHHAAFIADVSAAPSLIRSMFIMPGLKDLKHTVLVFEDKAVAAPYRKGLDSNKIAVVFLKAGKIEKIKLISTAKELQKLL